MKRGKSIVELAQEIERQQDEKRDFVTDTRRLELVTVPALGTDITKLGVRLAIDNGNGGHLVGVNQVAHRQLGEHVGIPAKYYDRMLTEDPELLTVNVNNWLHDQPKIRQVRTLDNTARAFLSDRYRSLDYFDLFEAVFPVLMDLKVEIVSCDVTETRLYIKAVDKRIERDIPKGAKMGDGSHHIFDTLSPAITVSNSEVGMGSVSVVAGVLTKACTNLAFFSQKAMRKYHVGSKHEIADGFAELFSDETKKLTDQATWHQVKDVVAGAFNEARFSTMIDDMRGMTEQKITGDVPKVVELAARKFNLNDTERKSVLQHLIEGADLSKYGLFNAVTRTAEDLDSYDRASELERLGGQLIELPANDWREIAAAA